MKLPIPIEELLPVLGIEVTPEVEKLLEAGRAVAPDNELNLLFALVGITIIKGIGSYGARSITAFERIAEELKNLTLEMELHRGAMQEVPKAIYDHTQQAFHATR